MTKENINAYINIVNSTLWKDSKRMQEYIIKKCSDVFKSSNNNFVEFEKPTIETRFCFGHGQNGITTQEETNMACKQAEHARTSEQYFIDENLEEINRKIKTFSEAQKLFLLPQYQNINNIAYIVTDEYFLHYPSYENKIIEELSENDRKELLKICENEKAKFLKRLQTYLKRYGLKKVQAWSYLVD